MASHRGVYENLSPVVAARRAAILGEERWFDPPADVPVRSGSLAGYIARPSQIVDALVEHGAFLSLLDMAPTAEQLLEGGSALGPVLPEDDELALSFAAHEGRVLMLKTAFDNHVDVFSQPFSTAPLRLHTESSTSPLEAQPRFILLACTTAPSRDRGLQTLLVQCKAILQALPNHVLKLLRVVRPDREGAPAVLSGD